MNEKQRKPGSGGARRVVDPEKGKAKAFNTTLYADEVKYLLSLHKSKSRAIRLLINFHKEHSEQ